jgi:hypothetical protein
MTESPNRPRVFGVGLSKTGTSSLSAALNLLGYRSCHYPPLDRLSQILQKHDAATDTSIACCFEELDTRYPGSKFILTLRDTASWLRSAAVEFEGRPVSERWKREVRLRIYGVLDWDPASFLRAYRRHETHVLSHFAGRLDALLVIDITSGKDRWTPLCRFLQCPVPDLPFPHENATDFGVVSRLAS